MGIDFSDLFEDVLRQRVEESIRQTRRQVKKVFCAIATDSGIIIPGTWRNGPEMKISFLRRYVFFQFEGQKFYQFVDDFYKEREGMRNLFPINEKTFDKYFVRIQP